MDVPLRTLIGQGHLDLTAFFRTAIRLCTSLDELHRRKLTYGAISPGSILVNPDNGDVRLLDIGQAPGLWTGDGTRAPRAAAYVSPEQTGRVNRTVD